MTHPIQDVPGQTVRILALASGRLGRSTDFDEAISDISKINTRRAQGSVHFLRGISSRRSGEFAKAEQELTEAKKFLPTSANVSRELLYVLNLRRKYNEALRVGLDALEQAPTDPYVIDGLIKTKIEMAPTVEQLDYDADFQEWMDRLHKYGHGPELSFYCLRQVDIYLRKKIYDEALKYANKAIEYTRSLPAAYRARSRVFSAKKLFGDAGKDIQKMREIIGSAPMGSPKRYLLFEFLLANFDFNIEKRKYTGCIPVLDQIKKYDSSIFEHLKRILVSEAHKDKKLKDPDLTKKLKTL